MEVSSAPAVGSAAASPRMERSSIFPKREQLLRGAGNSCEETSARVKSGCTARALSPAYLWSRSQSQEVISTSLPSGS